MTGFFKTIRLRETEYWTLIWEVEAAVYGVYRFFTPDYLEDFEDDFEDDYDDDFFEDEEDEEEPAKPAEKKEEE